MRSYLLWIPLALVACKAKTSSAPPCPTSYKDLKNAAGEAACACAANTARGSVWGVDVYTQDSALCAAAVHAGAIASSGGEIKVKPAPGCPSYQGSSRNGVTSGSWGNYPGSFYFVGKGDGTCNTGTAAAAPPPPPKPAAACPSTFLGIPGVGPATELTCECKAAQGLASVWGSNVYTQDSSICHAAVHAGALPATGGVIAVKAAPGCPRYSGTTQNGITTASWGAFAGSFYFPSKGTPECVKG